MGEATVTDLEQTVPSVDKTIHDIGAAWMLDPATSARGKEAGYENPFAFYFTGRGGVLGDVDASVVHAAFGWFEPTAVRVCWEEGVAVAGAREAARRYGRSCAQWGEEHLAGLDGADVARLTELADRVVDAADGSGLPVFAGWRAEETAPGGPARLMQRINVLREWRAALHLCATTAAGLDPLQTVLAAGGPARARFLGWRDVADDAAADASVVARRDEAEAATNRLTGAVYGRALTPAEFTEYAGLVEKAGAAALA
ncbi:evbL [Actinomadura sp. WMMB 499]|uniref:SCO6745 family protein n=1 Tax=Actinomadura sp. WMMB 499 TaxID=1219491 RepID=UPI001245E104|nr:evbL [Actinomadura sp. WMMB 499]QFG21152.1 evbL [Actinomadura sp. WMMB 499]